MSLWEHGPAKPWHIRNSNKGRSKRQTDRSLSWIESNVLWHVKFDEEQYQQLIDEFLLKHKQDIFNLLGMKHWQLNLEQAHEYQQVANMHHWQMDITQRYFRQHKGILLFPNAKFRSDYQEIFDVRSAMVHQLPMQVPQTLVNRQQWRVQPVNVYHINEIEAIGQLANSIFENGRFHVQEPLCKQTWIWGVGWDRSVLALAESGSLSITPKYHGKYGSMILTLTGKNATENAFNYRQLTNQWNKRNITNQLLKYPNVIIMACTKRKNGVIVSKNVDICAMALNPAGQKHWDELEKDKLRQIPSPPIIRFRISKDDIKESLEASGNDVTKTQQYWQERSSTINLKPFIAVKLPPGFKGTKTTNDRRWRMGRLVEKANELLQDAHNTAYRFQPKDEKQKMNQRVKVKNQKLKDNNIADDQNNVDDDQDVDIRLNRGNSNVIAHATGMSEECADSNSNQQGNRNDNSNEQDNRNDINSNQNAHISNTSDSTFNIYDEIPATEDGMHVWVDNNKNNNSNDNGNNNSNDNSNDNSTPHKLFPLARWQFNQGSPLTRMAENKWKWQRKHCKATIAQGDVLYELKFEDFCLLEWNVNLPLQNTNETANLINTDNLFDQINGIEYFYLRHEHIPEFDAASQGSSRLVAVTVQGVLFGLLQLWISVERPQELDAQGNTLGQKCIVQQRCSTANRIDLNCIEWDEKDGYKCKAINADLDLLDEIGTSKIKFDNNDVTHQLDVIRVELESILEADNSAKNMLAGIAKSTAKYPCSNCEANGTDLYSFPTPRTMCFRTRDPVETAMRAAQVSGDANIMGCKESPIYDAPVHKYAGSILHDWEGIFALILSCIKGCINAYSTGQAGIVMLQQKVDTVHKIFAKIMKKQDVRDFLQENEITEDIQHEIDRINAELHQLLPEYEAEEQKLKDEMKQSQADEMITYLNILKKYKINEYYCLAGSVQGVMCKRICKARKEMIVMLKNLSYPVGILWELLLQNANYLYSMLKHKHQTKFTNFELSTLKHAYIDFYHQLVLVVRLWRSDGDLTIKPHYLMHDLEQVFLTAISNAYTDEERIENVNQLIKAILRLYANCQGNRFGSKELFVGRRMNSRVLSCG
ncbi:MAG: hypothetical protein ACPG2Y_00410 [Acholeplasmataceae bacterium]